MVPRQQETQREDPVCRLPSPLEDIYGGGELGPTPAPGGPEEEETPGHSLRQAE